MTLQRCKETNARNAALKQVVAHARREIPQNSRHIKEDPAQLIDETQESRKQKAREAKIALAPIKKKSTPQ